MKKTLVIVESPAKAKTIGRYLGSNYRITASVGHIRDLPSSSLGVDVKNNYKPRYINMRGKHKVIKELKQAAEDAGEILIATDPDREGEAIAWHLAAILKIDPLSPCRITFNEITEKKVKEAVQSPRPIDMDLVDAQQARRILDRLVGYELSPLLWKKIRKGLSAGRVQSVATKMLVDREREIDAFIPEEYWNLQVALRKLNMEPAKDELVKRVSKDETDAETFARLLKYPDVFRGRFHGDLAKNGKARSIKLTNKEETDRVLTAIKDQDFVVHDIRKGQRKRKPRAPFTTSTLQQDASSRLGYTSRRTMRVAQQLYEGVEIKGQGQTALVTYIRTDSVRVSADAAASARELIVKQYGDDHLPKSPRQYSNKNASQDAHEAIRPAHFDLSPDSLRSTLSNEQYRLYKLIWERFLASQMVDAVLATLAIDTLAGGYLFRSNGESIIFPGFLAVYDDAKDTASEKKDDEDGDEEQEKREAAKAKEEGKERIPELTEGEELEQLQILAEQKFTQPPARYTEASLIKAMEEEGIGRPSTYAPTISTVLDRNYAEKDQRSLQPTDLGILVTEMLEENFENVVDTKFTAKMESELDTVEEGKQDYVSVLDAFYPAFHDLVEKAEENIEKVELPVVLTGEKCPECETGDQIIKDGRYGKFIACSRFPDCKYTAPILIKTGSHCPDCGADVVSRKSRKGRVFYICDKSVNKDCPFISWYNPVDGKNCDTCGSYMVERTARGKSFHACSNRECPTNKRSKTKSSKDKKEKSEN